MRKLTGLLGIAVLLLGMFGACSGGQQSTTTSTSQPAETGAPTWIRFVNAMPDGPAIDAIVGDTVVASGLGYQMWGDWVEVGSGELDVALRHGEAVELSDVYTFAPGQRYWILAYGMMNPVGSELSASFLIAAEENYNFTGDDSYIRFINVAAEGEAYGLTITTGGTWRLPFPNQSLGTISEYKLGPIDQNTFQIIPARDTSLPPITEFEGDLPVGIITNFVLSGRANNGSLEVFQISESAAR